MAAVRIPARHPVASSEALTGHVRNIARHVAHRSAELVRSIPTRLLGLLRHEARRLLIPLAALTVISSLATVAAPGLTQRPLLLVALSPRLSFLALAAPKVGLVPFLAVAGIRLCLADPFHFVLGRKHGTHAIARLTKRKWLRKAHDVASKSVPLLVFLRPNGTNLAIAGASSNRTLHIAAADIVGTLVYLLVVHQLGTSFVPH